MKYINDSKYILFILVSSLSILFAEANELFSTQHVNYKIEVGIESITKSEDDYIITIYAINPYDPIAGVQFKILPEDLFVIKEVYGGRTEEKGFQIHHNKSGTILGFSMVANTLDKSAIVSGSEKEKQNIVLAIKASANNIQSYDLDTEIILECVFASKKGLVLESKYVPFKLSQIQ